MSDYAPKKPWRVYGPRGFSTNHGSQSAAYRRVKDLTKHLGCAATVHHWEDGSWRLYENVEPLAPGSGSPVRSEEK